MKPGGFTGLKPGGGGAYTMLEPLDTQAITVRGRRRKKRDVSKNQNCYEEEEEGVFSSLGNLIPEFLYLG